MATILDHTEVSEQLVFLDFDEIAEFLGSTLPIIKAEVQSARDKTITSATKLVLPECVELCTTPNQIEHALLNLPHLVGEVECIQHPLKRYIQPELFML